MPSALLRIGLILAVALVVAASGVLGGDPDPPALRDGFEGARATWKQEQTDTAVNLLDHDRTDRAAHEGRVSERFHFEAGPGSALYYSYDLPKIPVVEQLEASLFVRSDRAGMQFFARVVLPADTDPDTRQPSFLMVPGTVYENTDRWQRLVLQDVHDEVERRARVLRLRTKRPVSLEGAYLDRLVVNLYGGPGETVVYVDELAIVPVPSAAAGARGPAPAAPVESGALPNPLSAAPEPPPGPPDTHATKHLSFVRNRLYKDGAGWVFTAIKAPGADPQALLRYGFDVLMLDLESDPGAAEKAAKSGFYLMPSLGGRNREPADLIAAATAYPARESVAFWNLGENLGSATDRTIREAERDRIRAIIAGLRRSPPEFSHLATAGVAGLLPDYARIPQNLDLIGVQPPGWGTAQEIRDFCIYLAQRRDLTVRNPQAFFWAMIQATPPEEVHQAVWGFDVPPAWGIARVQPEQLRLYTYAALAAGYRGLGFQADADLTRAAGRANLIEMAFLNAEVDLFESIIAEGFDPIPLLPTYPPDPPIVIVYTSPGAGSSNQGGMRLTTAKAEAKTRPEMKPHPSIIAAAISTKDNKGRLLLLADFAPNAQWQPIQMAFNDLKIRVPGAPESAQAFLVNLAEVKVLDRKRVPGGLEFTLPEFGTTALVLVTTELSLKEQIEAKVARIRSLAISMAIEQARLKHQWVGEINGRLNADGHKVVNSVELLAMADKYIGWAQEALEREDYGAAWAEARRSGRPLRILMFSHWQQALTDLVVAATPPEERHAPVPPPQPVFTRRKIPKPKVKKQPMRLLSPVASPPLLAFNTLPQHYLWVDWIKHANYGKNLLPSGSFDRPDVLTGEGWRADSYPIDGVSGTITSVEGGASDSSKRALKLAVAPAEGRSIDSLPPFLDQPVAAVRTPPVPVGAHQLIRISVKAKMPRAIPAGGGGLIVRDSLGGEPLQFRTTNPLPDWTELVLYRYVPAEGALSVTLGLAGFAEAYFDDLRIQAVESLRAGDDDDETAPRGTASPPQPPRTAAPAPRAFRR